MTTKKIKELVKIKDLTEFYGLGQNTVGNYLKDLKKLEEEGFVPPVGRHNLVKALVSYYLLNNLKEDDYKTEIENIVDKLDFIEEAMLILDKNILDRKQKSSLKEQTRGYIKEIKQFLEILS